MATRPTFDDAGVAITARFGRAVARLLLKRHAAGEAFNLTVILLSESLAEDIDGRHALPAPLLSNGNDPLGDSIWLVQAEIRNAFAVKQSLSDPGGAFIWINEAGFGSRPAIVVDARSPDWAARLYPCGVHLVEFWIEIDLSEGPIPREHIQGTIARFWEQGLRTPELCRLGGAVSVWENASAGIPKPRPEQKIQARLRDTLIGAYPRRRIRAEVRTEEGRADIFIISDTTADSGAPAQMTDWALELKALCDKTSTGNHLGPQETCNAITKGVVQARAYRSAQNGVNAALCCFEMRQADENDGQCFAHVKDHAEQHGIQLWRWFLYRSTDDARMDRYHSISAQGD